MICHHKECQEDISDLVQDHIQAHSMVAVLQKVSRESGYTFYQCELGQERKYVNYQHYHCSHSHMQQGMRTCLTDHYGESVLAPITPGRGQTILHKIVLLRNRLACMVCLKAIDDVAYRFCLTLCTPVNTIPDLSSNELGEWCCSLEHARQSALEIIDNLVELNHESAKKVGDQ